MGEKDDALFDKKVIRVIRRCFLTTAIIWIPVLGAVGTWLYDININVGNNVKGIAKIEVKIDYIVDDIRNKRP